MNHDATFAGLGVAGAEQYLTHLPVSPVARSPHRREIYRFLAGIFVLPPVLAEVALTRALETLRSSDEDGWKSGGMPWFAYRRFAQDIPAVIRTPGELLLDLFSESLTSSETGLLRLLAQTQDNDLRSRLMELLIKAASEPGA
ncbi:hypothetical protein ACTVH1_17845 [Gluconobacter cerinus]